MICIGCGRSEGVQLENSRTAYARSYTLWDALLHDGAIPDPNAPVPLCRDCAKEHHEYWNSMWDNYYAAIL